MYEINCYDLYGNTINNFTQWDVDQEIVIKFKGSDEDFFAIAPNVHFYNVKRKDALVVRSTKISYDAIRVQIPNILLEEPYPLLICVYLEDVNDVGSQKTVFTTEIPVRKKAQPNDYYYVENIERITAEKIKQEITESVVLVMEDDGNMNVTMYIAAVPENKM